MSDPTPGPWTFHGPPTNIIVWSDAESRVCFMPSDGNAEANARLIAAAPALLEALEDPELSELIYAWVNEKNIGREEYERRCAKIAKREAAIALARSDNALAKGEEA